MADRFDLNAATAAALEKIAGVTRGIANRIIAERKARGSFRSVEELREIEGITDEVFAALKENVFVRSEGSERSADVAIDLDPARKFQGRFGGYSIVASFGARLPLAGSGEVVLTPRALSTASNADGLAKIAMPELTTIEGATRFVVRAPDGQIVASAERSTDQLANPVAIQVVPRDLPLTGPAEDRGFGRPTRLRGRVIDRAGRVQIAGRQIIVWGAKVAEPTDKDFQPLAVAQTDSTGYFSTAYPLDTFTAAHAVVALDPTEAVAIHLADDGTFPGDLILVVDAPRRPIDAQDEKDCGCSDSSAGALRNPEAGDLVNGGGFSADVGQGRCVDFTRPDRTLQEFSYSYVVRTTEPSIKGVTLQDPPKISRALLAQIADLAQFDRVVAAAPQAAPQAAVLRAAIAPQVLELELDAAVTRRFAYRPDKVNAQALVELARTSKYLDVLRGIDRTLVRVPERGRLTCANSVDWDDDPTIYQACTIAHGHILHFKQEWIADGYSMGRLLYSLPLAPGQKKQIAVLDWERRESAVRQESIEEQESLVATISRDRDIGEMVSSVLTESSRGGSSASSGGFGAGLGIGAVLGPVGGLLGIGGGFSSADSNAWQNSSRNVSANSLQTLRDRTSQAAAAMRAQRSTVIQTVSQGERVSVTTETVANYNHCHALTIEYFEVLRHLLVRQRLVDVQECLFVPLQMTRFDRSKALRWRNTLRNAVLERSLRAGFDALERIDANYEGSDFPLGTYADQPLEYVEGDLSLRFQLARPRDKDDDFDAAAWTWIANILPFVNAQEAYRNFLKDQKFKDRVFIEQFGARIASAFVDLLKFSWIDSGNNEHALPIDPTLLSNFVNDTPLAVSLRLGDALAGIPRKDIRFVKISERSRLGPFLFDVLPAGSRVIVETGNMSYRTKHSTGYLFRNSRIANDLTAFDAVRIYTPLTAQELRNPREEDKELARRLLDHLNEHLERYHHALWWRMSPDRRYMLLDGFEAPGSGGRSVASVVDNSLIGIVGNCLVMPVSRGFHLDPTFNQSAERPVDLLEHYQPNTPIDPVRVAIPTRGVYAEAVTGACNSCEVKEEERYWRWEESPIPDSPPAILPTSTDSRRAEPPNLTAKDFPQPIIAMQNAPAAPDPTGLGAALNLLGQSNLFRDMAGLEGTQRNAAAALQGALDTATAFGTKAADLALQGKMSKDIDKAMKTIGAAKAQGLISDDQARQLTETAIRGMVGAGATNPPNATTADEVKALTTTAGQNSAAVSVTRPTGEKVEVDARSAGESNRSFIIETSGNDPQQRAFGPTANDKTSAVAMSVKVPRLPVGGSIRWSVPPDQRGRVDVGGANVALGERVTVRGLQPGLSAVDVEALDTGGSQVESIKLRLSVPQFVTVDEEKAAFEQALTDLKVLHLKGDILAEARRTCEQLLRTANVRLIWRVGVSPAETLPPHVAPSQVVALTLRGEPPAQPDGSPSGLEGFTDGPGGVIGLTVANETIDIWPGAFDNVIAGDPTFVDVETNALVIQLESQTVSDPAMEAFATKVFGRLIGEVMAHEIVHALIGTVHLPAAVDVNDLMEVGGNRSFRQRTGLEDTAHASPVDPANFVDHGSVAIAGVGVGNQALIDANFPVPPTFA